MSIAPNELNADEYISIHTSDKNAFKTCRQQWDFNSELRRGWRPKKPAMALDFGTAIHAGLEVMYEPSTWWMVRGELATIETRRTVYDMTIAKFVESMVKQKKSSLKLRNLETLDELEQEEYDKHLDLGKGMLEHYFSWHLTYDKFTPIAVEISFSIPVMVRTGLKTDDGTEIRIQMVDSNGLPVFYEGKIDLLLQDDDGKYWVWDDKTAARMVDIEYLELDEQVIAYIWAGRKNGFDIVGMVYNELYKGFPQRPSENKTRRQGRIFSVNKQQDTTYEAYVEALLEADEDLELYEDFLEWLKTNSKDYFRRTWIQKNKAQLRRFEERIGWEIDEMLNPNLKIYPSPNRMKCKYCSFRAACISKEEDGDFEFILRANYFNLVELKKNQRKQLQVTEEDGIRLL